MPVFIKAGIFSDGEYCMSDQYLCYDTDCDHREREADVTQTGKPLILYKYMMRERFFGSFKDYLDGKAYFAAPESLNDPMESIPVKRRVMWRGIGSGFENDRAGVFTRLAKYKICSLSKHSDNMAMWSHYAKDHTGVCIGFEINASLLDQQQIKYMEVLYEYNYIPIVASIANTEDIPEEVLSELFCRKLQDWKYEAEYRLIASLDKSEMLPIGSVKEIILGFKCTGFDLSKRTHFCLPDDITVKRVSFAHNDGKGYTLYVPNSTLGSNGRYSSAEWDYEITDSGVVIGEYWGNSRKIKIPEEIEHRPVFSIGKYIFLAEQDITAITIPRYVTQINKYAGFEMDLEKLDSITVENKNTAYSSEGGVLTDKRCAKIIFVPPCIETDNLHIPANVKEIKDGVFAPCRKLTAISIDSGNSAFVSIDGVLFSKDKTELIRYPAGKPGTQYEIPQGVTTIRPYAFRDSKLTSIIIPPSVTNIMCYAFHDCSELTSVTIPEQVTIIGDSAFSGCSKITSVTIPEGVTSIGKFTFRGCTALNDVNIKGRLTSIGDNAFAGCTSFVNVNIPETVTVIGENAFKHCTALTSVVLPGSVVRIGHSAFSKCAALVSLTFEGSITVDNFAADSFPGDLCDKWASGDGKAGTYTRKPGSESWIRTDDNRLLRDGDKD
jgi:hypothetical protein